ncbi:redox-sensitive transcriptional activator SoxR [Pseudomonas sp. MWU12-3103b]|uniref:redox-sensitive transcriptional activator SoxR n=1 Tax=Pseudomonas sp. MWU12-3103b TaxID=2928857 RepID=UPI001FFFB9E5|nr:redox-sensitive transcriptional activator SoxR [Pseudomonas sp. MWU12-3103b]
MNENISSAQRMSVGEVSKRSGVAVSTLHYYETKGLLEPQRTAGNQRVYSRGVLRRIAIIRVALSAGIPLAEIKKALEPIPHDRKPSASEWAEVSTEWSAELSRRIIQLQKLQGNLENCIGCGCLSLIHCPLRNPQDILGSAGSGPVRLLHEDQLD